MGYVKDTLQNLIREIVESEDLDLEVDPCVVRGLSNASSSSC